MKSHRIALTVVALALAFTSACGSDNGKGSEDSAKSSSSASASPSASPKGDSSKDKTSKREYFDPLKSKSSKGKDKSPSKSKNDGDRPSEADVVKALGSANSLVPYKVTDTEAKCVAKFVVNSDLTDSAVRALVKKDTQFDANKKDTDTLKALNKKYTKKCLN